MTLNDLMTEGMLSLSELRKIPVLELQEPADEKKLTELRELSEFFDKMKDCEFTVELRYDGEEKWIRSC